METDRSWHFYRRKGMYVHCYMLISVVEAPGCVHEFSGRAKICRRTTRQCRADMRQGLHLPLGLQDISRDLKLGSSHYFLRSNVPRSPSACHTRTVSMHILGHYRVHSLGIARIPAPDHWSVRQTTLIARLTVGCGPPAPQESSAKIGLSTAPFLGGDFCVSTVQYSPLRSPLRRHCQLIRFVLAKPSQTARSPLDRILESSPIISFRQGAYHQNLSSMPSQAFQLSLLCNFVIRHSDQMQHNCVGKFRHLHLLASNFEGLTDR